MLEVRDAGQKKAKKKEVVKMLFSSSFYGFGLDIYKKSRKEKWW